ncbi:MAG TPA: glycosyltransferase family 4 protein [Candidatus Binatia bacterium]|nr:glycosyltransferase family 4 protein [Candidatus Binatia bacterium]
MRIAYICADPGVPAFGHKGCSVHVQEVIRALLEQNAQVELFASRLEGTPPPDLRDIAIHPLPPVRKGELARREKAALVANNDLCAALERNGPFDMVYERYALWSFAGMEYARAARAPGLLEVNAPLIEEQAAHRGLLDRDGAERVAERVFSAATGLIAVSTEVAAYLESFPAARGRVQVVPNGVDPQRFPAGLAPACPAPPGTFTVGFVGSLKPWHGLPALVEAFALLHQQAPNCRLLIVGDGPQRDSLTTDLSTRGLSHAAHLTGAVAPNRIPGMLASMDVGVASYVTRSHFYFSPLKVYEYMAAGLPVVASRIGQLAGLFEDGVNGLLCPAGDPMALAAALERLRRAPRLRARLGQVARASVLRDHTWESVARRILDLARSAAAEPSLIPGVAG